ncbi:hypothetical protein [Calothrix sp. CCY 0018]|uniref:hypothetical protein n=1 Tax=Calothrix sp. CCY 0018 TaxID=3103864 RepID=UPI0039C5EF04
MQIPLIYPQLHLLLAIAELVLIGLSISLWRKSNNLAIILSLIVLVCTAYDNIVLFAGSLLEPGDLLLYLNKIRFLIHYLFLPLLIVVGVDLANRAGAVWATTVTKRLSWILAISLGVLDVIRRYVGSTFEPKYFAGITRYYSPDVLPVVTIAVSFFMVLIGIGILIRSRGKLPWLFIGTLVAFLGNGLPTNNFGTLPASLSEFVMILSLLVTERDVSVSPESFFNVCSGDLVTNK